jgi:hypothetical protein
VIFFDLGLNKTEVDTAIITAAATTPVKRRLICSIAACPVEMSTNLVSLQFGQSLQPRPEPVSRTSEPVMMMA